MDRAFQLTASRGGRRSAIPLKVNGQGISTHGLTRRPTKCYSIKSQWTGHFNSRPHEEADRRWTAAFMTKYISTHGLTRRPTETPDFKFQELQIFQLTASRGGRHSNTEIFDYLYPFQLTASRGGRHRTFSN